MLRLNTQSSNTPLEGMRETVSLKRARARSGTNARIVSTGEHS